jgi:phenylacetate-coenzyme A ligase PaaK-like adenylate-forming protein
MSNFSREAYAWTYEHLFYSTWQRFAHKRGVSSLLAAAERSQWRDPAAIEAEQLVSLRRMLAYAGANVPYYRDLFGRLRFDPRSVRSRADLASLPVLTRETIHERYADLVDPAHRGHNIRKGTSGTTGAPMRFEYSAESETWRQAMRLRAYAWAGYHPGMPTVHYWGAGDGPGGAPFKVRIDRALRREVYVDCIHQDEASLRATLALVRRMRPHAIVAYTQPLALFARWAEAQGVTDLQGIAVICGAEAVLAGDRLAMARVFGPAIFETYGARETMLIGAECERHRGLHLAEENIYVEIARNGAPLPDGESGDVLVTDLHNFGMPMIRYKNGDLATMARGGCACGRGLRRLEGVDGRRADTLVDREGRPIPGIVFLALIARYPLLMSQFRLVQRSGGDVVLEVVKGREWSNAAFEAVERGMRKHLRGLPFHAEFTEAIPAEPSGKHRPIVVDPPAA